MALEVFDNVNAGILHAEHDVDLWNRFLVRAKLYRECNDDENYDFIFTTWFGESFGVAYEREVLTRYGYPLGTTFIDAQEGECFLLSYVCPPGHSGARFAGIVFNLTTRVMYVP